GSPLGTAQDPGADPVAEVEDRRHGDGVGDPHRNHRQHQIDPEQDCQQAGERHLAGHWNERDEQSERAGAGHGVAVKVQQERIVEQTSEKPQFLPCLESLLVRQETLEKFAGHRDLIWWIRAARLINFPGRRNTTAAFFSFAAGVVMLQQGSALPELPWLLALALGALGLVRPGTRLIGAFCLGLLWASWQAGLALERRLPPALEGRDLTIEAQVVSLEVRAPDYTRLLVR